MGSEFELIQVLWMSLLLARMKKTHSEMKTLEWSQHVSHYKSMGFFPNAHGQLTPQSWSDLAEVRTHPRFHGCSRYLLNQSATPHRTLRFAFQNNCTENREIST